ncbi:MAG: hypothetical protein GWP08_04255 [Nitrospiraceae bacterium]|nr:hypothetical protein [Nitrospiraceae bacterium]
MKARCVCWLVAGVCLLVSGWASAQGVSFTTSRHVYERGKACTLTVSAPGAGSVAFDTNGWLAETVPATDGVARYTIDTTQLRAGDYTVRARSDGAAPEAVFALTIAKAHDGERMPVWRWGFGGSDPAWGLRHGFTGAFLSSVGDTPEALSARADDYARYLEEAGRQDFELGLYIDELSKQWNDDESVLSLLPDGSYVEGKPYPLEPAVVEKARQVVDAWVARFKDYPGLRHVMLHSEWQAPFCVNDTAVQLALEATGLDLREWVQDKWRLKPEQPGSVVNGVIADDNPRYRLMQWWWQRGHGTAVLNEMQHGIIKSHAPHLLTWHEPYRLAPVRNSHKGLDCIGTWTYGHPDIKRLCYTTYLQAAARPEGQLVQQDITLFVYGRFAVPIGDSTADLSQDFAGGDPYFVASPDYVREALWLVVSQRPDILCLYSAGRLAPENLTNDPFYAYPDTFNAIGQTCEELVQPYGPAILKSKRTPARVAVLMSAASTWFSASARLPGYPNEQTLPYATLLMMNHVPFEVVLDDDVTESGLDNYDVLVMPRADTLTRGMHEQIAAFAKGGGSVIADASLRASIPGAQITDYDFTHQMRIDGKALAAGNAVTAEEDRAIMEGYAAQLAPLLAGVARPAASVSPRVLTNSLDAGAARYHFFVNDERMYGPRFGQWKLRFELGVPQTAEMRILLDGRPALYNALRRERIEYETIDGKAVFDLRLPGARGALVVALPEAIGSVVLDAPAQGALGEPVTLAISVRGESGNDLPCVLPLRVDIVDPLGRKTEWNRYTATENGRRDLTFLPGLNDVPGVWSVRVSDLVAGKSARASIEVRPKAVE